MVSAFVLPGELPEANALEPEVNGHKFVITGTRRCFGEEVPLDEDLWNGGKQAFCGEDIVHYIPLVGLDVDFQNSK